MSEHLVTNPLFELCDKLGVSTGALAERSGVNEGDVFDPKPGNLLGDFLKCAKALGVRWQLVDDGPFRVWISYAAIDALASDNEWRHKTCLDPCPQNRGEMRAMIRSLRDQGKTYGETVNYLQDNWIPTAEGRRAWRRSTIGQYLQGKDYQPDADTPIKRDDEFLRLWRDHITDCVLSNIFRFSPMAMAEFDITPDWEFPDRIIVASHLPIPQAVKQWAVENLGALGWFKKDEWGILKEGE